LSSLGLGLPKIDLVPVSSEFYSGFPKIYLLADEAAPNIPVVAGFEKILPLDAY